MTGQAFVASALAIPIGLGGAVAAWRLLLGAIGGFVYARIRRSPAAQ